MADFTSRLAIRLIGGGSSGTIPDEVVDADDINSAWNKVDSAVGAPSYTSISRPTVPYDGQLIWETDTGKLMRYSSSAVAWEPVVPESTGTVFGNLLLNSEDAEEARGHLEGSEVGSAVFTAASVTAAREALRLFKGNGPGSPVTGDIRFRDA